MDENVQAAVDRKLLEAASRADAKGVASALAEGTDINARDKDQRTALHLSIVNNDEKTFKTLLALEGIDVNVRRFSETPLFDTLKAHNVRMTLALLDKGADPSAVNRFGETPLHVAAGWNAPQITAALLAKSADATQMDVTGKFPHARAYDKGYMEVGNLARGAWEEQEVARYNLRNTNGSDGENNPLQPYVLTTAKNWRELLGANEKAKEGERKWQNDVTQEAEGKIAVKERS